MKKTDPCGSILFAFLCTEGAAYVSFLILDLTSSFSSGSTALKFCSIFLCFCISLRFYNLPDHFLVSAALGLTLFADIFLLILDSHYLIGLLSFCCVQILYCLRIQRAGNFSAAHTVSVRFIITGLAISTLTALNILDVLTAVSGFYFIQLLINAAESLSICRMNLRYTLFSAGLILFLCCDICVGLYQLSFLSSFPEPVMFFIQIGMWLFYLPSQVLITLSSCISGSS